MYDRTSEAENVNDARKMLFTQKRRTSEHIPPSQEALLQHLKRVAYQAGYCWSQCLVSFPHLPLPSDWGWKKRWRTVVSLLEQST